LDFPALRLADLCSHSGEGPNCGGNIQVLWPDLGTRRVERAPDDDVPETPDVLVAREALQQESRLRPKARPASTELDVDPMYHHPGSGCDIGRALRQVWKDQPVAWGWPGVNRQRAHGGTERPSSPERPPLIVRQDLRPPDMK